jgi:tRNA threonylcarbamoyladenosine modification (KEOPS) complex  Pcc1 subunit
MFSARIEIPCKNPEYVKKSLEPDIEKDSNVKVSIKTKKGMLDLKIETEKLSYLKAVINSYLSLVSMLLEMEE